MARFFKRESKPEDPWELVNEAKKLIQRNENKKALRCLNTAIDKDPTIVDAYLEKATVLKRLSRQEQAIDCYEKVIEIAPESIKAYQSIAMDYVFLLGQPSIGLRYLNKALEIDPNNVDILGLKAGTLLKLDFIEEALETIDLALEIDPNELDHISLKATILMKAKRWDEAKKLNIQILKEMTGDDYFSQEHRKQSVISLMLIEKAMRKAIPTFTITDATKTVPEEKATKDDQVININSFLGLTVSKSLEETKKLLEEGEKSFNLVFEYILHLYADYRDDFDKRSKVFDIPEECLTILSKQHKKHLDDDFARAKLAFCYFMKNDYPQGLSLLNELDRSLSKDIKEFLLNFFYFKIQNPFSIDGVHLFRPLREQVLSIKDHLEYNDSQVNKKLDMTQDRKDRLFHLAVYQINLVLLLFLANLLERDEEEISFLKQKINLDGFNEELKNQLLKYTF